MAEKTVTACLLIIGNEILSGRTQDKNLCSIAERLNDWGIRLAEARVIADMEETIVETVNEVRRRFDYVITTGGIGPTHDDITSRSMAKAFGRPHKIHPEARAILERYYEAGRLNEARMRMAMTPEGAELILNPISSAPGFQVENVFVLAGIPRVMEAMLDSLEGRLAGGRPRRSRCVKVFLAEGTMAADLGALQDRFPEVEIGSYPFHEGGRYGARLLLTASDDERLGEAAQALAAVLARLGDAGVWEPQ
jgi:molybdenum cofactor synthesis domain-containing protein